MAAVGNYEVVVETFGPVTAGNFLDGEFPVPEGKRFLSVSVDKEGSGTASARINEDGTAIVWKLVASVATSTDVYMTIYAPAAEMGT